MLSFDLETHLIKPGMIMPRMVCLTVANQDTRESGLVLRDEGLELARKWLADPDTELVGQNVCFDLGVLCAEDESFVDLVFKAFDEGRIRDTMIRQKIIDNANGDLKYLFDEETESYKAANFSLQNLVYRHLKKYIPKGVDTWRLRYAELDGVPVAEWPEEATKYAIGDAVDTLAVYELQDETVLKFLWEEFTRKLKDDKATPPPSMSVMPGELRTLREAWALHLMGAWGLRTDGEMVAKLKADLEIDYADAVKRASDAGLMKITKRKTSRNMKAIRAAVEEHYNKNGLPIPHTEKGQISTDRDCLNNGLYPGVKKHPGLVAVSDVVRVQKLLKTYVPVLERGTTHPITPSYNVMVESFRTSCASPNIQNPPRKGGVRECFLPREGNVYVFADYSTLELCTLAQTCLDLFGYSRMAEAIRAGRDLHIAMGTEILGGMNYDDAVARFKEGDPLVKEARQFAKCFHPDTEVLTKTGWKKIADLSLDDEVAAAIPTNGVIQIEWQHPTGLQRLHADELVHLKCEGIDLRVTKDHRMLAFAFSGTPFVTTPQDLHDARGWYNAGTAPDGSWDPDERLLRLAVATQADGSYAEGHQIRFGFTKERKIERMRTLLEGISHVEGLTKNGKNPDVTSFSINGVNTYRSGRRHPDGPAAEIKTMLTDKMFDHRWLNLSARGREIVLDEIRYWDSGRGEHSVSWTYSSSLKQNVDIIQALATMSGVKTRAKTTHRKQGHADHHTLSIRAHETRKNDRSRGDTLKTTVLPYGGEVVCLSVPSSFVVVRDGGVPVVTGQCLNFGAPGGLGAATFVDYARASGITIDEKRSRELLDLYKRTWPEMDDYFRYIGNLCQMDENSIFHPRTEMRRGNVRYTAAANHFFQHLAAVGAKDALYHVSRECYTNRTSPLYGCRPVFFLHDEIGMEVSYADPKRASRAAARLSEVMVERMRVWCPDVPISAAPVMTRRWFKGAEGVYVDGLLVPSKPEKYVEKGKEKIRWIADEPFIQARAA